MRGLYTRKSRPSAPNSDALRVLIEQAIQNNATCPSLKDLQRIVEEAAQTIIKMNRILREAHKTMGRFEVSRLMQRLASHVDGDTYMTCVPVPDINSALIPKCDRPRLSVTQLVFLVEANTATELKPENSAHLVIATEHILGLIGREARQATDDAQRQLLADTLEPFTRNLPDQVRMSVISPNTRPRLVLVQDWGGTSWCLDTRPTAQAPGKPTSFLWEKGWRCQNQEEATRTAWDWVLYGQLVA